MTIIQRRKMIGIFRRRWRRRKWQLNGGTHAHAFASYSHVNQINHTTNHPGQWINECATRALLSLPIIPLLTPFLRLSGCVSHQIHHKNQTQARKTNVFILNTWILIFDKLFCSGCFCQRIYKIRIPILVLIRFIPFIHRDMASYWFMQCGAF